MADLMQEETKKNNVKYMVFCNSVSSCMHVEKALTQEGIACLPYHSELHSKECKANLASFREPTGTGCDLLICIDLAARGLDIPDIDHVVIFDFPNDPIGYLHRSGRAGRGGKEGRVTSFLEKRDEILGFSIKRAIERG